MMELVDAFIVFWGELDFFAWIVMPLLIFFARILDVTIGTLRIVMVSRGVKKFSVLLGFVEVMVWLLAITYILRNLTNPFNYIAYAGGFAMGNYVGLLIEERIALGVVAVQIMTSKDATDLLNFIREEGFRVTYMEGFECEERVNILFTIVRRKRLPQLLYMIKKFNPRAFYIIEDVRHVGEELPPLEPKLRDRIKNRILLFQKRK